MNDTPLTFEAPSYALLDKKSNAVRMTLFGNLAIFTNKEIAKNVAANMGEHVVVIPVSIRPITEN